MKKSIIKKGSEQLEKKVFYEKLILTLLNSDFQMDTERLEYSQEADAKLTKYALKMANNIAEAFLGNIHTSKIHSVFDQKEFKKDMGQFEQFTDLVFYKYVMTQPVIMPIVDADSMKDSDFKIMCEKFDEILLNFRKHTGKIGGTSLSVTGIVLFVFTNGDKAREFLNCQSKNCKIGHFFKKTWVLPWVADVSTGKIHDHSGLPFLPGVISKNDVQRNIFT